MQIFDDGFIVWVIWGGYLY